MIDGSIVNKLNREARERIDKQNFESYLATKTGIDQSEIRAVFRNGLRDARISALRAVARELGYDIKIVLQERRRINANNRT